MKCNKCHKHDREFDSKLCWRCSLDKVNGDLLLIGNDLKLLSKNMSQELNSRINLAQKIDNTQVRKKSQRRKTK